MTDRRAVWAVLALIALFAGATPPDEAGKPWAFRAVVRPEVPKAAHGSNPIDAFLDRALASEGLAAAPEADRRTLVRRLSFDLIGLPPTPEEVACFLADDRPDAYERLVDRLLASPHYGERWARHWLDLVRYAETHGYERDDPKPNAWKYRDWVVSALNRDMPYDRFLTEQLAGDELADATDESRTATGMYRLGPIDDEPADPVMDRFDQLDDMVKTIGTTMLGLTIHCARCHDHKFDPIKQSDYYRMLAFLTPSKPYVRGQDESISVLLASESERTRLSDFDAAIKRQVDRASTRIETLRAPHRKEVAGMPGEATALADARLTPSERAIKQECERTIALLERYRPTGLPMVLGLTDTGTTAEPTHLMLRGDAHRPGKALEPGFLSQIDGASPDIEPVPKAKTTGRRLALARWITRPENPLTARVMVNRLWQHHFGRGIVATPSDFGAMGEESSNPELLDWLAAEFVSRGWSLKAMHRLILSSAAYKRSSRWDDHAADVDPNNARLWRFAPQRLEAEPIRDAILAVSGALNPEMGGPSVRPVIDKAVLAGQSRPGNGWAVSSPKQASRRSLYVMVKRTLGLPELELLDAAENNEPCPRRAVTTTAPQALTLLNSAFLHEQAAIFADRLKRDSGDKEEAQIVRAFSLAFARTPSAAEQADSLDFLREQAGRVKLRPKPEDRGDPKTEALKALCLVILNTSEFISVD
ncbi:MAG: hypothetical protein JWN86_4569 [Planctomycetota bacterium]|nr:hypothetical protein [Planctomycetota bacterium]